MINCDDLQTAIKFVQSLESGLDRVKSHSPYTIVKADQSPARNTLDIHQAAHVSASDLYGTN